MISLKELREFEVPIEISRFLIFKDAVIISISELKNERYHNTVASYDWSRPMQHNWIREGVSSDISSGELLIAGGQLFYILDNSFFHSDPSTGKTIFQFKLKTGSWGPLLEYSNLIYFSTNNGSLYSYDPDKKTCSRIARFSSYFWQAVLANETFYALVEEDRMLLWKRRNSKFSVYTFNPRINQKRLFMKLGKSGYWSSFFPIRNDICISIGPRIERLNTKANVLWSFSIGPSTLSIEETTTFHGIFGNQLLVSAESHLCLVDMNDGTKCWAMEASSHIASAILLENGDVVFSTCGGGFAQLTAGVDPQNYIGLYSPSTGDSFKLYSLQDASRIDLQRLNDRIIARSCCKRFFGDFYTCFIEFSIS
ncbi:MAG: hypothetical protein JRI71_16055 [Deltaproteobacteria bacterium]|nr:hypothetical protein [Deltaproteobacteria bacterium]